MHKLSYECKKQPKLQYLNLKPISNFLAIKFALGRPRCASNLFLFGSVKATVLCTCTIT